MLFVYFYLKRVKKEMLYVIIDRGILYVALYAFFSIQVVHYCISITYISMCKRKSGALLSALQPNSLLSSTHIDRQGSSAGTSSHTPVLFIHINSTGRKNLKKKNSKSQTPDFKHNLPTDHLVKIDERSLGEQACVCSVHQGGWLFTWLVRWCSWPATCGAAADCFQAQVLAR